MATFTAFTAESNLRRYIADQALCFTAAAKSISDDATAAEFLAGQQRMHGIALAHYYMKLHASVAVASSSTSAGASLDVKPMVEILGTLPDMPTTEVALCEQTVVAPSAVVELPSELNNDKLSAPSVTSSAVDEESVKVEVNITPSTSVDMPSEAKVIAEILETPAEAATTETARLSNEDILALELAHPDVATPTIEKIPSDFDITPSTSVDMPSEAKVIPEIIGTQVDATTTEAASSSNEEILPIKTDVEKTLADIIGAPADGVAHSNEDISFSEVVAPSAVVELPPALHEEDLSTATVEAKEDQVIVKIEVDLAPSTSADAPLEAKPLADIPEPAADALITKVAPPSNADSLPTELKQQQSVAEVSFRTDDSVEESEELALSCSPGAASPVLPSDAPAKDTEHMDITFGTEIPPQDASTKHTDVPPPPPNAEIPPQPLRDDSTSTLMENDTEAPVEPVRPCSPTMKNKKAARKAASKQRQKTKKPSAAKGSPPPNARLPVSSTHSRK
ncbi:hypothetical protein HDU96_008409 [Phlyctochytrium bullatum]|nr:hypothetical protein HDU96_008409 [Phlyctochytrium bullatum]